MGKTWPPSFIHYLITCLLIAISFELHAQGTWIALRDTAPGLNNGVMLLLTDGSVITTITDDPNAVWDDSCGPAWNKLIPDSTGSYVNGKWEPMASMHNSRIYFSTWVLPNGKVYAAGGEFGTGGGAAELYDPLTDTWSPIPGLPGYSLADANSQMLPDGRILQNSVYSELQGYGLKNYFYNPDSNSFSVAPQCFYPDDEASWLKLPDNSIIYEVTDATASQRYIPALNRWIPDADLPTSLYDSFGSETGAAVMLPDGRALFLGSNGNTAFYTPTGDTTMGTWTAGPIIPNNLGAPDAAASMLPNGQVLCAFAPVPNGSNMDSIFHPIMFFYLFDYTTDSFTQIPAPGGGWSINQPSCSSIMLNLADGNILFGVEGSNQYYVYTPAGPPVPAGKPTVDTVTETDCQYMITGTLFNGISQGSAYGDDWQMATNYPMVRLIANGHTYYTRTTNWSRTGISTGSLPDTAFFTVPTGTPYGTYSLLLSANGISCDTFTFQYTNCLTGIEPTAMANQLQITPNPSTGHFSIHFPGNQSEYPVEIYNTLGQKIEHLSLTSSQNIINLSNQPTGMYFVYIKTDGAILSGKLMIAR